MLLFEWTRKSVGGWPRPSKYLHRIENRTCKYLTTFDSCSGSEVILQNNEASPCAPRIHGCILRTPRPCPSPLIIKNLCENWGCFVVSVCFFRKAVGYASRTQLGSTRAGRPFGNKYYWQHVIIIWKRVMRATYWLTQVRFVFAIFSSYCVPWAGRYLSWRPSTSPTVSSCWPTQPSGSKRIRSISLS